MYILDSNVVRLYLRHQNQNPRLVQRIQSTPVDQLWITVISVEEGIAGARKFEGKNPVLYSEILAQVVADLGKFQILPFSQASWELYRSMPESAKQHARNDWKIAAIALTHEYTVVTCNVRDFAKVRPEVKYEDWTR